MHDDEIDDSVRADVGTERGSNRVFGRLVAAVRGLSHAVREWAMGWVAVVRRAVPASDLLWEFGSRFRRLNGSVLVGYATYRLFLWLVPLVFVFTAILGYSSSSGLFSVLTYAGEFGLSEDMASDLTEQAERGRFVVLMGGIFTLVIATRGLIRGMHYTFAQASGVEITRRAGLFRQVGVTIPAALLLSAFLAVASLLQRQGIVLTVSSWAGSWVLVACLFWVVCWTMPRRGARWRDIAPGPVLASAGLSTVQVFVSAYLPGRIESASALYGSLGIALAVLFYMFLVASVVVAMPFVNGVWVDRHDLLRGRPWILDPNALPGWIRRPARWAANKFRTIPR